MRHARLTARTARLATMAVALSLSCPARVWSATQPAPGAWISLGVLGGSTLPDRALANYQWDTRPRVAYGAQALWGTRRIAAGARAWRSSTVQTLELPSGTVSPDVRSTSIEALGRFRVTSFAGTAVSLAASTGRLAIDYKPDHVVISSGSGDDVVAHLAPVSAWTGTVGAAAERELFADWCAGVSVDRRLFALDTAHRSGSTVVNSRETFGDWSTRLELTWRRSLTVKGMSR